MGGTLVATVSGAGPTYNVAVSGMYLSTDASFGPGDVPLAVRSVPGLAAGGVNFGISRGTIPNSTAPGNYFLIVVADANGAIAESNELNNTDARAITVR